MALNRWTSASGGSFAVANNWSLDRVPGSADDAVVDLSGAYTISVTNAFGVGALSIAQPGVTLVVQTPGTTDTVLDDLTNSGTLQLDYTSGVGGTSISVSGTLTNSGTINVGSFYGSLTAAETVTAAHVVNTGTISLFGGAGPSGALSTLEDTGDAAPSVLLDSLSLSGHAVFDFGAGGGVTSLGSVS